MSNDFDKDLEQFLKSHPLANFPQSFEWPRVKGEWQGIPLSIRRNGAIVAGAVVLKRKVPRLNKSILYIPRGPIMDFGDESLLGEMRQRLDLLMREHRGIFVKMDPGVPTSPEMLDRLTRFGFMPAGGGEGHFDGIQPKFVMRLPMGGKSLDDIFSDFASKTRYNIRLATKKGVTVRLGALGDMPDFYRVLTITAKRDKFLIRSLDYFENMYRALEPCGMLRLYLAYHEGALIGGTIGLCYGNKFWYLYGAGDNEHRNLMAGHLLQWEMIKTAHQLGIEIYDFRGVSGDTSPDSPVYGLYRFKQGFNAELVEFVGELTLTGSKFYTWAYERAWPWLGKVKSHLAGRR